MLQLCKKIKNKFQTLILPLVVGIATAGLQFSFANFLPAIKSDSMRTMLETSTVVSYLMCFISYYYAINITNSIPESLIMPRHKKHLKFNHPVYSIRNQCDKENHRYKPPRTSHCHVCKCVSRMDHHCPYTNGCVGARNLKAFILFCGYGGIFALHFLILSYVYFRKLSDGAVAPISELKILYWVLLTVVSFLLSCSMNSLAVSNILLASKNITQIEMLKGQFLWSDKHKLYPNPYDLGLLTNLNTVFGSDHWLFWWPTQLTSHNDHTQFPMKPPVTSDDFLTLPPQVQDQLQDQTAQAIPKTMEELRKKEQSKYQGVIFFYQAKQYRLTSEEIRSQLAEINASSAKDIEEESEESEEGDQASQDNEADLLEEEAEGTQMLSSAYSTSNPMEDKLG